MIVTNVEQGWEIVFQTAHGVLAGAIAGHLKEEWRSKFWPYTLAAIIGHDDFKETFEEGQSVYVTEVGAPRDFQLVSMKSEQRVDENRRRLIEAYRKHRWIGLLQSQHIDNLYSGNDVSSDLNDLLAQEKKRRPQVLKELGMKKKELAQAYETLQWCDRCSLILCQQKLPAMERKLEIMTTAAGAEYSISEPSPGTVHVDPWPFRDKQFSVELDVYCLSKLAFQDDAELEQALIGCEPEFRVWNFEA
ncbi:MAG: hypothetical protein CMJ47_01150 [Planctomyces sp.]|nr:hypothetical protein [Planctomyces sp.]